MGEGGDWWSWATGVIAESISRVYQGVVTSISEAWDTHCQFSIKTLLSKKEAWENKCVLLCFIDPRVRKIRNEAWSCPGIFSRTLRVYYVASSPGSPCDVHCLEDTGWLSAFQFSPTGIFIPVGKASELIEGTPIWFTTKSYVVKLIHMCFPIVLICCLIGYSTPIWCVF